METINKQYKTVPMYTIDERLTHIEDDLSFGKILLISAILITGYIIIQIVIEVSDYLAKFQFY